jgi:hypothetical protein
MAVIREWFGWALVVLGLLLVALVIYLAVNRHVFEAMAVSLPSVIVFRAGIGLVRLAVASRIARALIRREDNGSSPLA